MPRQYKCQVCGKKDFDENMQIILAGSTNKRYHKEGCYQKFLDDQEFKAKEKKEWDSCYETIKKVHGIEIQLPPSFVPFVQRLRNGEPLIGMKKSDKKRFKEGFTYTVIEEAYRRKADLINWKKKDWDGSTGKFLQFVLFYYITDIIEDVNREFKKKEHQEQIIKNQEEQSEKRYQQEQERTVTHYRKKESKNDTSSFLD